MNVRYEDWYRYDPINDRQVVRLLAITGTGTYTSEFSAEPGAELRVKRERFKQYVVDCIEKGVAPHEAEMDDA